MEMQTDQLKSYRNSLMYFCKVLRSATHANPFFLSPWQLLHWHPWRHPKQRCAETLEELQVLKVRLEQWLGYNIGLRENMVAIYPQRCQFQWEIGAKSSSFGVPFSDVPFKSWIIHTFWGIGIPSLILVWWWDDQNPQYVQCNLTMAYIYICC